MAPQSILVGILAGLASALLFAGIVTQSVSAVGLSLAAPIPILLASLGWGSASGFVAAFAAAGAVSLFTGTSAGGLMILASTGLSSAVVGHLAGLARPSDDPTRQSTPPLVGPAPVPLDWYPLDRILLAITLSAALGCLFLGWLVGFDPADAAPMLTEALVAQGAAGLDTNEAQIAMLAETVVALVPFVQPAFLVGTLVASLYLAAVIARASGRLQRPRDDVPAGAGLPRASLAVFALALAGSFLDGSAGAIAAVFAGAFACAFTLVGLAGFHLRTRGRPARGLLLFLLYAAIVILTFPLIAFLVYGVFRTARADEAPTSHP
ncbi:hypothetical protein [Aureimonas populi]|uniref:DUF2232 domain-containing protein n=1 Tax=Aureimonas populi TaxID=1701758 RepID=A0ABW5CH68_9HYPH|nr:hypothetical protein [Aureimonas populi]